MVPLEHFAVGLGHRNLVSSFVRPTPRGILWIIKKKSIPLPEKKIRKPVKNERLLWFPWYMI